MKIDKDMRESAAVVIGGLALFIACLMTAGRLGWYSTPLIVAICWREWVFTGMRVELDELRKKR